MNKITPKPVGATKTAGPSCQNASITMPLILVTQGYSFREIGRILLIDDESISRWVALYQANGLNALKNHPGWGGEHGQRFLQADELLQLTNWLAAEAMPGTKAGGAAYQTKRSGPGACEAWLFPPAHPVATRR